MPDLQARARESCASATEGGCPPRISADAADYEWLSQWTWHLSTGYAVRHEKRKRIYMHRETMTPPQGMLVDHIDGNRGNNCRCNLGICTPQENQRNKRKQDGARSKFKGVCYNEQKRRWYAKCRVGDERPCLGYFATEIEAARAYDFAAVAGYGKYARVNLPKEWPPERRAQVYADAHPPREALDAKIAQAQRQKARKAKAKSRKARGRRQKRSETPPARVKTPRGHKRKRPPHEAKQATKKSPAKTRRPRKTSEAA